MMMLKVIMLVTLRELKTLKVVETWLSTVSCSTSQPAMARPCPPSVDLQQTKIVPKNQN